MERAHLTHTVYTVVWASVGHFFLFSFTGHKFGHCCSHPVETAPTSFHVFSCILHCSSWPWLKLTGKAIAHMTLSNSALRSTLTYCWCWMKNSKMSALQGLRKTKRSTRTICWPYLNRSAFCVFRGTPQTRVSAKWVSYSGQFIQEIQIGSPKFIISNCAFCCCNQELL